MFLYHRTKLRGSATLTIEQEDFPLFFSSEWIIRAKVDGQVVAESEPGKMAVTKGAVRQWARAFMRRHYERLLMAGVDVEKHYVDWGGRLEDL